MFEKVNPSHPDKVADRIAGAIVDLAYTKKENPIVAVEVLIGHNNATVIIETDTDFKNNEIFKIVKRLSNVNEENVNLVIVPQDENLNDNQKNEMRCGDNGIFKGVPLTNEEIELSEIARNLYEKYQSDGKYILNSSYLIICQSNAKTEDIKKIYNAARINPLGEWTGGINVDSGATNRKLGSDMGQSITGGGLHGKDLTKSDVSINIYAWLKAQEIKKPVEIYCAIGDNTIDGKKYSEIVEIARNYIKSIGGFEKFAEWGFI